MPFSHLPHDVAAWPSQLAAAPVYLPLDGALTPAARLPASAGYLVLMGEQLTREQVDSSLHSVTPDGRILSGMASVRAAYRAAGMGWIMAPTGWPLLRPMFDAAYRVFARNRISWGKKSGGKNAC